MRLLLDSSVVFTFLLSGAPEKTAAAELFRGAASGAVALVWSATIDAEIRAAHASRPWLQDRIPSARLDDSLGQIAALAEIARSAAMPAPRVVRDVDDDFIVDVAISAGVDLVVTLDRDLLALGVHAGIAFVKPGAALALLRQAGLLS